MNKWKVMTEEKNLNVFKEISNTLKSMKQEWRKEQEDMATEVSSIGDYVTNAKKSLPAELRKTVQTVVTIFNGEFDVLAEELDLLTEMIALAKKETEEHVQEQVYKLKTEII